MPARLPGDMLASEPSKSTRKMLSYASNGSSETKYETAAHEGRPRVAGCLNGGSDDDNETANEDALSSTVSIREEATERKSGDLA